MNVPGKSWQRLSPPYASPDQLSKVWTQVFRGGWASGPRTRTFERQLARRLGVPAEWVLATRSATVALEAAYRFLVPDLDRIRVSPLTFHSTYSGAVNAGLDIDFVDTDDDGWPVGPVDVGVDLWGRRCPTKVRILDAAHRLLGEEHGDRIREDGTAVVYSFDARKECPSLVGGAIVSKALPGSGIERWLNFGLTETDEGRAPVSRDFGGTNGGMPDPIAVWLREALKRFPRTHEKRQTVLRHYAKWLGSALLTRAGESSGHLVVVRLSDPGTTKLVRLALTKSRVQHSLHYPVPEFCGCPNARALTARLITLPCHSEMRPESDVRRVSRVILHA